MLCHFHALTFLHNITLKQINFDSWSHSGREPCSVSDTSSNTTRTYTLTNDAWGELQLQTLIRWEWEQASFSGLKDSISLKLSYFMNLPDCTTRSDTCLYLHHTHISDD